MPAVINQAAIEAQMLNAHSVDLQNKAFRAQNAYNLLIQYDWNGTGAMPSPIEWTAPTGLVFRYENGAGELQYASTVYSSLSSAQKRDFFQYLPKFIQACLDAYDNAYLL